MSDTYTSHVDLYKMAVIVDVLLYLKITLDDEIKYASIKVKALIDTGSNGTCISRRIASACRLNPISAIRITSAQGESVVPVYESDLTLSCNARFERVSMTEVAGSENFDVIIGMDILSQGAIALTGDKEGLVFSMRFPSKKEPVDFAKLDIS